MTACDTCATEIPPGLEVYVPDAEDPLGGPVLTLCRGCADMTELPGWTEPHLPEDETGGSSGTTSEREPIPHGAPPGDTYSRKQAAQVLGLSERRISQLATEGRLAVVQDSPLRVSAESVHVLRAERRGGGDPRAAVPPDPAADVAAQVERVVSLVVAEHRRALEAGESLLAEVSAQRDDYRTEAERLRAELDAERTARAEAERLAAERSRRWWRR